MSVIYLDDSFIVEMDLFASISCIYSIHEVLAAHVYTKDKCLICIRLLVRYWIVGMFHSRNICDSLRFQMDALFVNIAIDWHNIDHMQKKNTTKLMKMI